MKKTSLFLSLLFSIACSFCQTNTSFNVYFNLDKHTITADAANSLDSFLSGSLPGASIKLYGHCDIAAGYAYNDALSLKRVSAVKEYLTSKGFDATNIIVKKGFGKRRLINNNSNEFERYLNRRVEVVITNAIQKTGTLELSTKAALPEKKLTEQIKEATITSGKNIILKNLNFYGGTHRVLPESMPILQELLDAMKNNPLLEIIIKGHICCQDGPGDGTDIETQTNNLSENRAKEIYNYLHQNGVAISRLQYKGLGHQFPLTSSVETTEEERTANRRVEIEILKK